MRIADYSVLAEVGQSLLRVLREQMVPELIEQPELIGLASPLDKWDLSLSLFLFNVTEAADHRKTNMISKGSSALQYPPLAVNLQYLITAFSMAETPSRAINEHRMLGKVMQVFHDNSVLRGSALTGTLADGNEEIKISTSALPLDQLLSFFSESPYKLSLCYTVGPVFLDSTRVKPTQRVVETQFHLRDTGGQ
ncbi:DUF4255 domain-containing protein [Paenibacillus koleovorans]|uniref:DUF4255 domain-containing protein n=1 Tax=Paenibacillus koleovorans TaxID=121608 RepID=UPI000FDA154C|nr:DUF4255 domain-containing protein [Paenibacillus koleovorans]